MEAEQKLEQSYFSSESQLLIDGMKLAIKKVYEQARRDDAKVAIMRDGKVVHVKARELMMNDESPVLRQAAWGFEEKESD